MTFVPADWDALVLSLEVASLATVVALPLAVAAAFVFSNWSRSRRSIAEAIATLPLVLPPILPGYALLYLCGRNGPLGRWLWQHFSLTVVFTPAAAALATAVIVFPLIYRAAAQAIEASDPRYGQLAASLGASRRRVFWTVRLPLVFPGLLTGGLLGFARGLGEFGATIMVAGNIPGVTQTLPLAIFSAVQSGNDEHAGKLAVVAALFALILVVATQWLGSHFGKRGYVAQFRY